MAGSMRYQGVVLSLVLLVAAATSAAALEQGHGHERHVRFWEVLMLRPFGVDSSHGGPPGPPPAVLCTGTPLPDPPTALAGSTAGFSNWNCDLQAQTCVALCSGEAASATATCTNGAWEVTASTCSAGACFSADTRVVVKGAQSPVTMRELRVGQHVMCFNASLDMMAPGAPAWCEVKNFAVANDDSFAAFRLIFRAHDGALATTTVAGLHVMQVITDAAPQAEASTPNELGSSAFKFAQDIRPGDLLPVATSRDTNANSFRPAVVEGVERLTAVGKFIPALEMPFILADGVVAPLWSAWPKHHAAGVLTELQTTNALLHMILAPLWMTAAQPAGTPGQQAQWDGRPKAALVETLMASFNSTPSVAAAVGTANLTRTQEWFAPRYQAWKADSSKGITVADVLEVWPSLFDGVRGADAQAVAPSCALSMSSGACGAGAHSA